jgi:hypothetical protein
VSLVALLVGVVALIVGTKDEWGWIVLASAFLVAGGARGLQLAGIHRLLRHGRSVFRGRSGDGSP